MASNHITTVTVSSNHCIQTGFYSPLNPHIYFVLLLFFNVGLLFTFSNVTNPIKLRCFPPFNLNQTFLSVLRPAIDTYLFFSIVLSKCQLYIMCLLIINYFIFYLARSTLLYLTIAIQMIMIG